jgi:hypothetical protein
MERQEYNKFSGDYQNTPQTPPAQPFTQQYVPNDAPPMKPKNWMTEAILVTVVPFCCLCSFLSLLGIVAIVYAGKVDKLYFAGQYGEAEQAAKDAKLWVMIGLGIAVLGFIANMIMYIVMFNNSDFMNEFIEALQSITDGSATEW